MGKGCAGVRVFTLGAGYCSPGRTQSSLSYATVDCRWLPADFLFRCRTAVPFAAHNPQSQVPTAKCNHSQRGCSDEWGEGGRGWLAGSGCISEAHLRPHNGFDSFVAKFAKMF